MSTTNEIVQAFSLYTYAFVFPNYFMKNILKSRCEEFRRYCIFLRIDCLHVGHSGVPWYYTDANFSFIVYIGQSFCIYTACPYFAGLGVPITALRLLFCTNNKFRQRVDVIDCAKAVYKAGSLSSSWAASNMPFILLLKIFLNIL